MGILDEIKKPKSNVFRRILVKRRSQDTGLFESEWQDISTYVKRWGNIRTNVDSERVSRFQFNSFNCTMDNREGKFNAHDDISSMWYGYLDQQRSLIKVQVGFTEVTRGTNGVNRLIEYPNNAIWDSGSYWDEGASWDTQNVTFRGILSGDQVLSDNNDAALTIKPVNQIFIDFAARNLTGWTSTGLSASQFCTMLRDQTDGSGSFIFRPFFDDTTTNWNISTTTATYANLNTSTAADILDMNCWQVLEKLAEVENYVCYVGKDGKFNFEPRSGGTSTAFEFHGFGSFDTTYGHTIKSISSFGKKLTKFYSRIEVKRLAADTTTSLEVEQSNMEVASDNAAWALGQRTLRIENLWIQDATTAAAIAQTLFDDLSAIKNEIEFTTTLVPHLNLLDKVTIHYDPNPITGNSLWDTYNWADTSTGIDSGFDLEWDDSRGSGIYLNGDEYKILAEDINLESLETKFVCRRV